jgi:hypothetical protein
MNGPELLWRLRAFALRLPQPVDFPGQPKILVGQAASIVGAQRQRHLVVTDENVGAPTFYTIRARPKALVNIS